MVSNTKNIKMSITCLIENSMYKNYKNNKVIYIPANYMFYNEDNESICKRWEKTLIYEKGDYEKWLLQK